MSRRGWCQDSRWSCYQSATTAGEPWPGLCMHTQDSTSAAHLQGRPQAGPELQTAGDTRVMHACTTVLARGDACTHDGSDGRGHNGCAQHTLAGERAFLTIIQPMMQPGCALTGIR